MSILKEFRAEDTNMYHENVKSIASEGADSIVSIQLYVDKKNQFNSMTSGKVVC